MTGRSWSATIRRYGSLSANACRVGLGRAGRSVEATGMACIRWSRLMRACGCRSDRYRLRAWQKKIYPSSWCPFHPCQRMNGILLANRPLPEEERYDGYLQLENGVGMLRLLYEEVKAGSGRRWRWMHRRHRVLSLATGRLAAPYLEKLGGDDSGEAAKSDACRCTRSGTIFSESALQ